MIEYRTKIKDTFIGMWFGGDKGNIVLACGIPQYIDKYHPIIEQISRLGYNLFVPRYHGTFESSGKFSVLSSKKTIENTVTLVTKGKAIELFKNSEITWNHNIPLYVLGFSYGALPALLSNNNIDKTILVCPFIDVNYHLEKSSGENLKETFEFIERAYPNLYRLKAYDVLKDLSIVELPEKKNSLIVVYSLEDTSIPKEEIDLLIQKYPNTKLITKNGGHSIKISDELFLSILN